jgi:hypothetical protein
MFDAPVNLVGLTCASTESTTCFARRDVCVKMRLRHLAVEELYQVAVTLIS